MTRRRTALAALVLAVGAVGAAAPVLTASAAGETCERGVVALDPATPPALALLQAERTWTRSTGAGVIVAVVDSGVDAANPHLAGALIGGIDLVGDGADPNGYTDLDGHGTEIAGQIAARAVEGSGVVGLARDASLLAVRVFRGTDDESVRNGWGPTTERVAQGIRYAVDAGASVINVSISNYTESEDLRSAVEYASTNGALVVASGGNAATTDNLAATPRYPAAYPGALAVTAVTNGGLGTDDSIHGPHIEIAAPGASVLTSFAGGGDCTLAEVPSSSFATAYVSAAAALVAQAHPDETPAEWEYRLTATATRADPDHRDDVLGWGVVQPYEAVMLLPDSSTRGPESPFAETAGSLVRPAEITVTPDFSPSGFTFTTDALVLVAVLSLTVLGALAAIIVLRTRRREAAAPDETATTSGGLLDRPKSP